MGLTGPVTDAERRGWQRRDALALVELLAEAHAANLPPIAWRIGFTGGLVGTCAALDPDRQRDEFEAWATFLERSGEVERWPEQTYGGVTRLRVWRRRAASGRVDVGIVADIHDEDVDVDG